MKTQDLPDLIIDALEALFALAFFGLLLLPLTVVVGLASVLAFFWGRLVLEARNSYRVGVRP